MMVVGQAHGQKVPVDTTALKVRQTTIHTSLSADISHYYDALKFLQSFGDSLQLEKIVTSSQYALSDVSEALDAMKTGKEMKKIFMLLNELAIKLEINLTTDSGIEINFNRIHKEMTPQVNSLFGLQPKTPFEVRRTEASNHCEWSVDHVEQEEPILPDDYTDDGISFCYDDTNP